MSSSTFIIIPILLFTSLVFAQPLRVGTSLSLSYEPLFLAQEIDAFAKDIRIINYPSSSSVVNAFKNKTLEAAAISLYEVAALAESDIAVEIILILDVSSGSDVIMAKPEIKNMQGIIGAKVAIESPAIGAYTLTRALNINKINITDIRLINAVNNDHKLLYESNQADVIVTNEPIRTQLLNSGAIEIFSSREIPKEIFYVLAVHKDKIKSHQDELLDISQGWFRALQHLKDEPLAAYNFIASRMKITTREAKESHHGLSLPNLKKNKELLSGSPSPLSTTFQHLMQHMKNNHLIAPSSYLVATTNNSFLP